MRAKGTLARSWSVFLLKLLLALGAVAWLLGTDRLSLRTVLGAQVGVVLLGVVPLVLINLVAQAIRWYCLLRSQDARTPLARVIELAWIGNFWATVSPGGLGGELARGYLIYQGEGSRKAAAALSVVADRALGLVTFLGLGAGVWGWLLLHGAAPAGLYRVGAISAGLLAVAVLGLWGLWQSNRLAGLLPLSFQGWVKGGRALVATAAAHRGWVLSAVAVSLTAAIALTASFSVAALALQSPLGLEKAFLAVPHVVIANTLPLSPGGVGVGESAASLLFQEMGRADGAELMLLVRAVVYALRLPGALLLLSQRA